MENLRNTRNKTFKSLPKRPKSGVQWDTSLNPFLRPYTAKIKKNKENVRPESSKQCAESTVARTTELKTQYNAKTI